MSEAVRRALVLFPILAALPLGGCVVAAVPVLAGAVIARGEMKRGDRPAAAQPEPVKPVSVTVGDTQETAPKATLTPLTALPSPLDAAPAASDAADGFTPLLDHVRSRVTLWREGAPIKSLVLDEKQTVLNPIAIDCQRRQPVVLIDLDPATETYGGSQSASSATQGWPTALRAIREMDVGVIWITGRPTTAIAAIRDQLLLSAIDPQSRDQIAALKAPGMRKQEVRLDAARGHCVLAVIGDKRGDADEAYDYLRDPKASLLVDSNWGAGWFLLPAPLRASEGG